VGGASKSARLLKKDRGNLQAFRKGGGTFDKKGRKRSVKKSPCRESNESEGLYAVTDGEQILNNKRRKREIGKANQDSYQHKNGRHLLEANEKGIGGDNLLMWGGLE